MSKQHTNVNLNSDKTVLITTRFNAFAITFKDNVQPNVIATIITNTVQLSRTTNDCDPDNSPTYLSKISRMGGS